MNKKTQMLIRTAVIDYIKMFPQEYNDLLYTIQIQRQGLKDEMATVKGHALKRGLFTISEKLSSMLEKKLSIDELREFRTKDGGRWFAKEFPQFSLTKKV